jgi:hypothetical protein
MSAAWAASSAGIIVIGVSAVLLWFTGKHGHRVPSWMPSWFRPLLYQVAIAGMYVGGDAVAQTALGRYPESLLRWAVSPLGAAGGHDALVITACVLLVAAVAGLVFEPGNAEAFIAAGLPPVLLVAGGALAQFALWLPVVKWSAGFSHWIGG